MFHQRGTFVRFFVFLFAFAGIFMLVLADGYSQTGKLAGVPVLDREQWDALYDECREYGAFDVSTIYWQDESIPYDKKTGNVYLPQSKGSKTWSGSLTAAEEGIQLFFLENPDMGNMAHCLENNVQFQLAVIVGDMWTQTTVVFTGMPAICIWGDAEERVLSYMHILDPDNLSGEGNSLWLRCRFRPRGTSSLSADIQNYRLWLCDDSDTYVKENLFGIRKDEDWILNGFYLDPLLMREKLGYQLWEDINKLEDEPVKSSSVTYVELFINDEYKGVYGLMPRVDAKQVGLKDGIIYKVKSWSMPSLEDISAAEGKDVLTLPDGGVLATMEYPNAGGSWQPFLAYCDFYESGDMDRLKEAGLLLDLDNVIAYNLFNALIQGEDNYWKNLHLILRTQEQGDTIVTMSPWDLDMTFGTRLAYLKNPEKLQESRTIPDNISWSWIYSAMEKLDPQFLFEASKTKWNSWKNAGINAEYLCQMADAQLEYLKSSGALLRSSDRSGYHRLDFDLETERLQGWIERRFDQLDSYFSEN